MSKSSTAGYIAGKSCQLKNLIYTVVCVCTAMIGYHIHHSKFWAVMDFLFTPLTWIKWLVCHQVTWQIIQDTFRWFFASLVVVAAVMLGGCSQTQTSAVPLDPVGTWQAVSLGGGSVFELDTRDGHGYIVMPLGVVDLGTTDNPIMDAKARKGVTDDDIRALPQSPNPGMRL